MMLCRSAETSFSLEFFCLLFYCRPQLPYFLEQGASEQGGTNETSAFILRSSAPIRTRSTSSPYLSSRRNAAVNPPPRVQARRRAQGGRKRNKARKKKAVFGGFHRSEQFHRNRGRWRENGPTGEPPPGHPPVESTSSTLRRVFAEQRKKGCFTEQGGSDAGRRCGGRD